MRVFIVAFAALTGACWTWPDVTQPGIEIRVADAAGSPISDANVTLARYSVSMVPSERTETFAADASGVIRIPGERQWQFHLALPDMGGPVWSWSWCVEAGGFTPVFENDLRSSGYKSLEQVTLVRADSRQRCEWNCYPCAFSAASE